MQLKSSPYAWLEGRGPQLTALGLQDDASGKILAAEFFFLQTAQFPPEKDFSVRLDILFSEELPGWWAFRMGELHSNWCGAPVVHCGLLAPPTMRCVNAAR